VLAWQIELRVGQVPGLEHAEVFGPQARELVEQRVERSRTSLASARSKSTSARPPFEVEQMRNTVNHWHEQ
jgi:hypothetical protein